MERIDGAGAVIKIGDRVKYVGKSKDIPKGSIGVVENTYEEINGEKHILIRWNIHEVERTFPRLTIHHSHVKSKNLIKQGN